MLSSIILKVCIYVISYEIVMTFVIRALCYKTETDHVIGGPWAAKPPSKPLKNGQGEYFIRF